MRSGKSNKPIETVAYKPRRKKKSKGANTEQKIRTTIGNRDPLPRLFLCMPAPDNPRFNAISYPNLKGKQKIKCEWIALVKTTSVREEERFTLEWCGYVFSWGLSCVVLCCVLVGGS